MNHQRTDHILVAGAGVESKRTTEKTMDDYRNTGSAGLETGGDHELADLAASAVEALNDLLESGHLRDPHNADQALNVRFDDGTSEIIVEVDGEPLARFELSGYEDEGDIDVIALGLAVLQSFERYRESRRV